MIDADLQERILQAKYGIIKLNDGKIEHYPLVPHNVFENFIFRTYIRLEVFGVQACKKIDFLRKLNNNDAKVVWGQHVDLEFLGLKSKRNGTYSDISTMFKEVDNVARIKGLDYINGATSVVKRSIMERFGYTFLNKNLEISYYRKNINN